MTPTTKGFIMLAIALSALVGLFALGPVGAVLGGIICWLVIKAKN